VVEDLERVLGPDGHLERVAGLHIRDEHGHAVVGRVPEERDLDPVAFPVGKLPDGRSLVLVRVVIVRLPSFSVVCMGRR
jgi:hypothetical protein